MQNRINPDAVQPSNGDDSCSVDGDAQMNSPSKPTMNRPRNGRLAMMRNSVRNLFQNDSSEMKKFKGHLQHKKKKMLTSGQLSDLFRRLDKVQLYCNQKNSCK